MYIKETKFDCSQFDEKFTPNISEANARKKDKNKLGKKKKKQMKSMMKFVTIGIILFSKVGLMFKLLHSHLQIKFLTIAAISLILQILKFWLDIKTGYNPPRYLHYDVSSHTASAHNNHNWARNGNEQHSKQDLVFHAHRFRKNNETFHLSKPK